MTSELRFLVVEDQTLFRQLLIRNVKEDYPRSEITEVGDLPALKAVKGRFDLALDWLEGWTKDTGNKAIILSAISSDRTLFRALRSPIMGYVHKEETMETLKLGIRCVLGGAVFFSTKMQEMRRRMSANPVFFNKVLSEREQEILEYLGQGLGNEEIASLLALKASSVADHRKNIMSKLDLHNQADVMKYASKTGFARF